MGRREAEAAFGAWELVEARASHADDHHPQQLEAHKAAFDRAAQEYYEDQIIKTLAAATAQVHCDVLTVTEGRDELPLVEDALTAETQLTAHQRRTQQAWDEARDVLRMQSELHLALASTDEWEALQTQRL